MISAQTRIEEVRDEDGAQEFCAFTDVVHGSREVRWPSMGIGQVEFLTGRSPYNQGRHIRPLVVRRDGEIVARAVAVADDRYNAHWNDTLGHLSMFEALPDTRDEVRALADEASSWLRDRGCTAVRAGFGCQDMPFCTDAYTDLPPVIMRQNGPYYHALLKDAGFETEQGWVDYKMPVTEELEQRYTSCLEAAEARGFELRPLSSIDPDRRADLVAGLWAETFRTHWGFNAFTPAELREIFDVVGVLGALETSVVAYKDGEAAGFLFFTPSAWAMAAGRAVREDEKLNTLGIGVREAYRGQGLNMAMAARAYLMMIEQGATWLSYTLVLDHNWASRRTGEKLGGRVCANYLTYRRNLAAR